MPRYGKNKPRHRKPSWLTRKSESTWRGFVTFTLGVVVLCGSLFVAT